MPLISELNADELRSELNAYDALAPIIEAAADEQDRTSVWLRDPKPRQTANRLWAHWAMRLKPFEEILDAPAASEKVN